MTPRKNRPVLFELASRTGRGRTWSVAPSLSNRSATPAAQPQTAASRTTEVAAGTSRKLMRIAGGRVLLDLSWPHLVAAAALLIVVLVATFEAGARSARPAAAKPTNLDAILHARPEPPSAEPEPVAPRSTPRPGGGAPAATPQSLVQEESPSAAEAVPSTPAAEASPAFEFQPGCAYVVIQHLSKRPVGVQAAAKIREFLASKGIATVVRPGGGDLEVIATEPFRTRQPDKAAAARERERAVKFMEQIRNLGKEYSIVGGYSFDKCYLREAP